MKKLFVLMFLGMFLFSFASAAIEEIGPFKQGETVELIQNCDDCTYNNITTILTANGSLLRINAGMEQDGSFYNLSFNDKKFYPLGKYYVNGIGDPGGVKASWAYTLLITPSGKTLETPEAIIYVLLMTFNLMAFVFFLYLAMKIPYGNKFDDKGSVVLVTKTKYFKLIFSLLSYGTFLWFLAMFTGLINNFISLEVFRRIISGLYIIASGIGIGFTIFIMAVIFIEIWRDILFNNEVKKYEKSILK